MLCKTVRQIAIYRTVPFENVGGDAYIAPRANVGIGPYGFYRRCSTNWNLAVWLFRFVTIS